MMPRRRPVDNPPPTFPEGFSEDREVSICSTFNGHKSMAWYRTDTWGDGEFEARRNHYDCDEDDY